jgi:small subunit ribosomal protein S1
LSLAHRGSDKLQPEERWSRLVGATVHVKVIELNRRRKRLILSERAAERLVREAKKAELLESLRGGEVRKGIVSSLADFGAFVDLGGADGLVHVSELSWNRSAKPRDVVDVGQEVEVYVLNVDRQRKRIALSLKRLEPEPWTTVESRFYVGQLVEGVVTRLANFGAFAVVNGELEGLIHISELSNERINHPQDVVSEGEKHVMRIIRIDPKRRRMGLSLKRVTDPAYADLDWQAELAEAQEEFEADGEPTLEVAAASPLEASSEPEDEELDAAPTEDQDWEDESDEEEEGWDENDEEDDDDWDGDQDDEEEEEEEDWDENDEEDDDDWDGDQDDEEEEEEDWDENDEEDDDDDWDDDEDDDWDDDEDDED